MSRSLYVDIGLVCRVSSFFLFYCITKMQIPCPNLHARYARIEPLLFFHFSYVQVSFDMCVSLDGEVGLLFKVSLLDES